MATPTQLPTAIATAIPTSSPVVVEEGSTKGGQGNRPPIVEAALTAVEASKDKQRFIIVATATDPDGNLREVVAVIRTPPLNPNHELELQVKEKIEIKFNPNKVEISGPNPQAILDQIRQYGGIVVQDGQLIELKITNSPNFKIDFEETLQFEAQSIVLQVIAVDTEGASAGSVASPAFDPGWDDDGNDNGDDNGGDNETGPPTSKDQCKKDGWKRFDTPRTFKNQGDCIQYVNTGK